jgi:hypothetical protein
MTPDERARFIASELNLDEHEEEFVRAQIAAAMEQVLEEERG